MAKKTGKVREFRQSGKVGTLSSHRVCPYYFCWFGKFMFTYKKFHNVSNISIFVWLRDRGKLTDLLVSRRYGSLTVSVMLYMHTLLENKFVVSQKISTLCFISDKFNWSRVPLFQWWCTHSSGVPCWNTPSIYLPNQIYGILFKCDCFICGAVNLANTDPWCKSRCEPDFTPPTSRLIIHREHDPVPWTFVKQQH